MSIILDEITPHLRGFYLLEQYVYPTLRVAVHAGANGPTVGQLMHGKAPMQPSALEDDLNLIRRVVGRDRQAFETLYHRYSPVVYRYLWKLIRQREIAEEALNDVMMVVWETASRFNGTSRLSTWILGIAHNKALKARARSAKFDTELRQAEPDGVESTGPEDAWAHRELASGVARAIDSLPAEQGVVVELTFYHDLSYAEIAKIVGCPVNTVKTRMFHARRRLASLFAAESQRS